MAKKSTTRRKKRSTKKNSVMTIVLIGLIAILVVALFTGIAGWMGYEAGKESVIESYEKKVQQYKKDLDILRKKLDEESKKRVQKEAPISVFNSLELSEINDYKEAAKEGKTTTKEIKNIKSKKKLISSKGKLVIIIDDIDTAYQINAIKSLPWKITPSIFPPYKKHKNSVKLAQKAKHYMVHLPMEALKHRFHEVETLTTKDSELQIDDKIKYIRKNFPDAKFINNHTGSKFTSDYNSVKKLFKALKKYNFEFVDSRTTPKTVVPKICENYGKIYIARDVFIDNESDVNYIKNQIKKAVKIAKQHGYAIAIGHPHVATFKAIAKSKDILNSIDVVYIDELYKELIH